MCLGKEIFLLLLFCAFASGAFSVYKLPSDWNKQGSILRFCSHAPNDMQYCSLQLADEKPQYKIFTDFYRIDENKWGIKSNYWTAGVENGLEMSAPYVNLDKETFPFLHFCVAWHIDRDRDVIDMHYEFPDDKVLPLFVLQRHMSDVKYAHIDHNCGDEKYTYFQVNGKNIPLDHINQ